MVPNVFGQKGICSIRPNSARALAVERGKGGMHILDILGLLLVFAIIAVVGACSSAKVKKLSDFTLASNSLGKIQTGFSMAATEFGGSSLIGAIALCYTVGISGAWWDWSAVPAFLLLGVFFAGKIRLPNMVTITDFFQIRYDRRTKSLASAMHILAIATQLSAQFTVSAVALNGIFGIPREWGMLIGIVLVLAYTTGGGLIAVVNTDVVQFIIIVASLLIAVPVAIKNAGGIAGILQEVPASFLEPADIGVATIASWCIFCFFTYATNQHYMQRVFAAKDTATARFSFLFTGISYWFYGFIMAILGICIAVLLPGLEDPNMGYALFLRQYMPVGLVGLSLGAIFAATMSTADSMLLAASTLFVNDLYKPYIRPQAHDSDCLRVIRISTVLICFFSVGVSLLMSNIVQIMYLGGLFYSTAVFFPLILGMVWPRGTKQAALGSMVITVLVGLVSELFLAGKLEGLLGMPSNILAATASIGSYIAISCCTGGRKSGSVEQ